MTVNVIGLDGGELAAPAREALAAATLVVGGRRHLSLVAGLLPAGARLVELGPLAPALTAVAAHNGPAVVLASGDPGWYGIVRALATALPAPPRVIPAPSSLSRLAAALGRPWDDISAYSGHGRDPRAAINAARALPAVAVLTGPGLTVNDLARALDGWPRLLTVGERLGHPDERVTTCPASDAAELRWAVPNLVLVTDPDRSGPSPKDEAGWALPESEYQHRDSMIRAEVRALAVARLARPPAG
jgi:precorrin-6Y C5,15-methyltransferase (decarboxylating)